MESILSAQSLPDAAQRRVKQVDFLLREHDRHAPKIPVRVDWDAQGKGWRVRLMADDRPPPIAIQSMPELWAFLMGMRHAANGWQGGVVLRTEREGLAWRAGKRLMLGDEA